MKEFLRNATSEDAKFLFELRNDKETRKNSINKDEIDYDTHIRWYLNKIKDENSHIFILSDGKSNIGQIRMDVNEDNVAIISYSISKEFRNKGYGTVMLSMAEEKMRILYPEIKFRGEVIEGNIASERVFQKLGYKKVESADCVAKFEKQ